MVIESRHIGGISCKLIEVTVKGNGSEITEDVSDLNGYVNKDFIQSLRDLADELSEHNADLEAYNFNIILYSK
jgi:hypothetical protein